MDETSGEIDERDIEGQIGKYFERDKKGEGYEMGEIMGGKQSRTIVDNGQSNHMDI